MNNGFDFGTAIELLKQGFKIQRISWPDKSFVVYNHGSNYQSVEMAEGSFYSTLGITSCVISPHFDKCNQSNDQITMQVGWYPDQDDLNAQDWQVVHG